MPEGKASAPRKQPMKTSPLRCKHLALCLALIVFAGLCDAMPAAAQFGLGPFRLHLVPHYSYRVRHYRHHRRFGRHHHHHRRHFGHRHHSGRHGHHGGGGGGGSSVTPY